MSQEEKDFKACPICNGEVKGDDEVKYYCKNCNLLFSQEYYSSKKNQQ